MDDDMRQLHNTLAAVGVKTEWYYESGRGHYVVHTRVNPEQVLTMRFYEPINVDACVQYVMQSLALYYERKYP